MSLDIRVCIFLILIGLNWQISVDGTSCGFPGRPRNGNFNSTNNGFLVSPGENVTYKCDEGFVLFGPDQRNCQKNGTWSGILPQCRQNLALNKSALQSSTLWNYNPELAVDSNPETCSFTPRSSEQRWWQVHLGERLKVQSVAVSLSPGSYQKFTIFIIELLEGNKAMYKACSKFDGNFETQKAVFLCNDGLGHPGQFVYIRDDRSEPDYFGLCEVEVYEFKNETLCGEPEKPLHSTTDLKDDHVVYGCLKGYTIDEGDPKRKCINGIWEGPTPPQCSEVLCSDPSSVKDGFIEVSNFKGKYIFGSVATYHCNPGHILWGNASRLCSEEGIWTGTRPQCKPITCGPPPQVPNSKYALLNGTSTWLSKAVYSCKVGHRMEHHQSNVSLGSMTAQCSDQGIWQPVNFHCIFDPLAVNLKEGANYDWKSAFEENGSLKLGTLVTIGVLSTLVFLVIVIVIIFFWQRRSGPSGIRTPSPKISRSSTNQLIADVAKGLAAHFDGPEEPYHDLSGHYRSGFESRSAGDGGSEEGHYASLKPQNDQEASHYALVRQPDGRPDDPTYSSLCETPREDGVYESLQQPSNYAGISMAAYESLPRSHNRTNLVGIQSFSRSSSLKNSKDSQVLYAQVDRSKKRQKTDRESLGGNSSTSETCSPISNPLRTLLDEQLTGSNREPLYATIGHKQRPIMSKRPEDV